MIRFFDKKVFFICDTPNYAKTRPIFIDLIYGIVISILGLWRSTRAFCITIFSGSGQNKNLLFINCYSYSVLFKKGFWKKIAQDCSLLEFQFHKSEFCLNYLKVLFNHIWKILEISIILRTFSKVCATRLCFLAHKPPSR